MIKAAYSLLIPISLLFISCNSKKEADLLVYNANIYTVDSTFSKASAFAVKDGKFIAVGTDKEILSGFRAAEQRDLMGKTILPGLIDAHCHFYGLGLGQQIIDLKGTNSFDEVLKRVISYYDNYKPPTIRGRGWDQNDWDIKEFPDKAKLDSLFPNIPVVLERIDGHAYLVNQTALNISGITKDTHVDGGAIIIKDGKTSGILIDNPMLLVDKALPPTNKINQIRALLEAQKTCFSYGLTTVNDAGLDKEIIQLIDSLQKTGDLKIRVYAMVSNSQENLDYYLKQGVYKTEGLHVRSIKVYADGALGSRGAALKKPYSDKPLHYGAMVTPIADMARIAKLIVASDYQMNTHAIGDSANLSVFKIYSEALAEKKDRRWKVEHAQVISPSDFHYFSRNIIPSVQPTHATSDMYWAEDRLGPERITGAYAYKTLLNQAGILALGTDFPVEEVNPFYTFYAAVVRKDLNNYPSEGFHLQEALSREEALKGMTIWAAFSNFEENEKGSIEIGKWADFVALDQDIMSIPEDHIPSTKVLSTFLGGKQVKM